MEDEKRIAKDLVISHTRPNQTPCEAYNHALITVTVIMVQWEVIDAYLLDGCGKFCQGLKFWQGVKNELLKLQEEYDNKREN